MKRKLELNNLKVSSFITALNKNNEYTIKGGTGTLAPLEVVSAVAGVVGAVAAVTLLAYEVLKDESSDDSEGAVIVNGNNNNINSNTNKKNK